MAGNHSIFEMKLASMEEVLRDKAIVKAISHPSAAGGDNWKELAGKIAFDFLRIPDSLEIPAAYLNFLVSIKEPDTLNISSPWITPALEIMVVTPENLLKITDIPDISLNRNDYISQLLIEKFEGRTYLGSSESDHSLNLLGRLMLTGNSEGRSGSCLYRKLTFTTRDLSCIPRESR